MIEDKQELKLVQKNKTLIQKLQENNLDFNDLFILECFYYEEDREFLDMFTIPSLRNLNLSISFQNLKKHEYLVENPEDTSKFIISVKGKDLLESLYLKPTEVGVSNALQIVNGFGKSPDECFEEWWKAYPTTPAWQSDDGVKFIGSRHLKNLTKLKAKKAYFKLLNQGLKHEDLIGALKFEIKLKKLDSIKKNQNQMDFFKGMESYLNQGRYMDFMEAYRENPSFVKDEDIARARKKHTYDI
jgi:hypothetical protein